MYLIDLMNNIIISTLHRKISGAIESDRTPVRVKETQLRSYFFFFLFLSVISDSHSHCDSTSTSKVVFLCTTYFSKYIFNIVMGNFASWATLRAPPPQETRL